MPEGDLRAKLEKLDANLRKLGSVVVAYSGGADSGFLAAEARKVLGDRMVAVTAVSASLTPKEAEEAGAVARKAGFPHEFIVSDEFTNLDYLANNRDRCYHCKKELFEKLTAYAAQRGFQSVVEGSNVDDTADFRPGRKAVAEAGVSSPLLKAGLTKSEVRALARDMGLANWDKPSQACLASRVPYGTKISAPLLERIGGAEAFLHGLGFREVRVRHHGELARIEVGRDEVERLAAPDVRAKVDSHLRSLGYTYVTLDLAGYRTGSMNETRAKH